MCGLWGAYSTLITDPEIRNVFNLGLVSSLRGLDGTGLIDFVQKPTGKDKQIAYWKEEVTSIYFSSVSMPRTYEKRWKNSLPVLMAGHSRAATKGDVNKKNSHPFLHGNIIGMHNGTIHQEFENSDKFETDSEALIYNINKHGIDKTVEFLNHKYPAYALCWVNTKDKTVSFLRNNKRSLFSVVYNQVMYWASESSFIKASVRDAWNRGITLTPAEVKAGQLTVFSLENPSLDPIEVRTIDQSKEDTSKLTHHTGSVYKNGKWYENLSHATTDFLRGELKRIESLGDDKRQPPNEHQDSITKRFYNDYLYTRIQNYRDELKRRESQSVIPFHGGKSGKKHYFIFDKEVTEFEYKSKMLKGCANCNHVISEDSSEEPFWLDEKDFLCEDCLIGIAQSPLTHPFLEYAPSFYGEKILREAMIVGTRMLKEEVIDVDYDDPVEDNWGEPNPNPVIN